MDGTYKYQGVQLYCDDTATFQDESCDPLHDFAATDGAKENLDGCELAEGCEPGDEVIEQWKPTTPQYCKEIAAYYQQSKRTIQKWFVDLREIVPWLEESELRLQDDRYTPLAVELLGDRYFAGSKKKWATLLTERFAERAQAETAIDPDVLSFEENGFSAASTGGSLVPTGTDYLSALAEEEAELQAIEARELKLLGRMSDGLERLKQASSQWERASQLRRQRLLRKTRIEAASLAVELEEEFDHTLRETQYRIQHGDLSMPGKPPTETPQSA